MKILKATAKTITIGSDNDPIYENHQRIGRQFRSGEWQRMKRKTITIAHISNGNLYAGETQTHKIEDLFEGIEKQAFNAMGIPNI